MIRVIHPGFFSSIQDLGREGYTHWGVPVSGSMDRASALLANLLVGNKSDQAVIGFAMQGPTLMFTASCTVAVTGARFEVFLDDSPQLMEHAFYVTAGQTLHFGKLEKGLRAYLSVAGGFQTKEVLGSRSYFKGITKKVHLEKDMEISYNPHQKLIITQWDHLERTPLDATILEAYKGPDFELLDVHQQAALTEVQFQVNNRNNRMAYQLDPTIGPLSSQILTGIVIPGSVQLTPSGSLFILMRDGQTTGGYPRILQLTESSINALAQLRTGQKFGFQIIEISE